MKKDFQELFLKQWKQYFTGAQIPITYYYTDEVEREDLEDIKNEDRCLIGNLNRVREGHAFVYTEESPGCSGGKRYAGFKQTIGPDFEYFLSCGIHPLRHPANILYLKGGIHYRTTIIPWQLSSLQQQILYQAFLLWQILTEMIRMG
jgi:hypothetical protein